MPTSYLRGVCMLLLGGLGLAGCRPGGGAETGTTGDDDSTTGALMPDELGPREGPWEVALEALPFPIADVRTLTVGRKEYDGNFANRGVIEVLFDHDEPTITIETRKYVFGIA